jgi:hypothetical protein
MRVFFLAGSIFFLLGVLISFRYLYLYLTAAVGGHIQSLILSAVLIILGVQLYVVGVVSELISVNRLLSEDILYRLRKMELGAVPGKGTDSAGSDSLACPSATSFGTHKHP